MKVYYVTGHGPGFEEFQFAFVSWRWLELILWAPIGVAECGNIGIID